MAKRKVYSADVKVWATLYVVASNAKEARRMMSERMGDAIEIDSVDVFGGGFADPDMPAVSYSPTMTIDQRGRLHGFGLADECEIATADGEG